MRKLLTVAERIWPKVAKTEGCWEWAGAKNDKGYGVIRVQIGSRTRILRVHRVVYEMLVGPIAPGLTLDHLCRNRKCCNPADLEPVTKRVNILRGVGLAAQRAKQTHCIHGHEFSEENTCFSGLTGRQRACRTCARIRSRAKRLQSRHGATGTTPKDREGGVLSREHLS